MVDLKKDIEKTIAAQSEVNVAEQNLDVEARAVYKASRDFNLTQYKIFECWNGGVWKNKAENISFNEVLSKESHATILTEWQDIVTDVTDLRSWHDLQKYASVVLGKSTDKVEFDAAVASGKHVRKVVAAFIKTTRHNATTLKMKINKLQVDVDKDKALLQQHQSALTEANILAATVPAGPPLAASDLTVGKLGALMDGIADIPELTTFTIQDSKAFNHAHILRLHSESAIKDKVVPYGLSANMWLVKAQAEDAVAQCFGASMASFLGSAEYKSPAGRATQTLNGITNIGSALRSVVVIPGGECIKVTSETLKQVVKSSKQQG